MRPVGRLFYAAIEAASYKIPRSRCPLARLPQQSQKNLLKYCHDIDVLVCPCVIQESDVFLSAKDIPSGNG
jgi:hypothetical protein